MNRNSSIGWVLPLAGITAGLALSNGWLIVGTIAVVVLVKVLPKIKVERASKGFFDIFK